MAEVTDVLRLVTVIHSQFEHLWSDGLWLSARSSLGDIGQLPMIHEALHVLVPKVVRIVQVLWDCHLESFVFREVSH